MKRKLVILLLLINFFAFPETTSTTEINWEHQLITVKIQSKLDENIILPEAKIIAKEEISVALPLIMRRSLQSFFINSSQTVQDYIFRDINTLQRFEAFTSLRFREKIYLSDDLKYLNAEYVFPVFPNFASFFVTHNFASNIQQSLMYTPSANFTGIVIYAADRLPLFGQKKESYLELCLFPKILTETGEILFQPQNMEPQRLKDYGPVRYVSDISNVPKVVVGDNPLNIVATAVFGSNMTDIVIPKEYAEIILSKNENINLLKQGKIVIICNKEKITQTVTLENI
ncbi:MAG: hypothetical protein JXR63_01195 [Spirochaetales bacterium]|nr:hypothetical protein [Spirochaetales bacterium]